MTAGDAEATATRFEPKPSPEAEPFWEGTRTGRFLLPWCRTCNRPHWFPRVVCPNDLSPDLEWREASGAGTVYAVSVMPKPGNPFMAGREPYAVALIDLAEGVRMMSEVIGPEPDAVRVGDAVRLAWEPLTDGRMLPVWELEVEG